MPEEILPQDIKERYEKAAMAVERKNYPYAIELLSHVINIRPDFAPARQLLRTAEIRDFDENPPGVLARVIRQILSLVYTLVARGYESKGHYQKAINVYEQTLKNDPKNVGLLIRLGRLLRREGMKEASIVMLENAVNIGSKNPDAFESLGEVYSESGDYGRARYCYKKVLELRPRDTKADAALRNLDALSTIDKSFKDKGDDDFKVREITE